MNNATRTRLWRQTDQPRQLSNQRNTHQYVNSNKICRSFRTIFLSLRWYGCQYVRSLRQPSKSLSGPQRTVQSLTFKIKLMFPQRKVVFKTHWGNHYVMKRPEYWPKSLSFDTNIICRGDEAFQVHNQHTKSYNSATFKRVSRSCRTMTLQNGGSNSFCGGKAKDCFTFCCNPALVRLFMAPLEQESFCKRTTTKSKLCTARNPRVRKNYHLPFSFVCSVLPQLPSSSDEGLSLHSH